MCLDGENLAVDPEAANAVVSTELESSEQATKKALATWDREPMFHISSPIEGWEGPKPERHHDFIDVIDFPECWNELVLTVEVEAKAKEPAVLKLKTDLEQRHAPKKV